MGEMVKFVSNGDTVAAYMSAPERGAGPGVILIGESSGLSDHLKSVCDQYAAEGFTVLAPDLEHGGPADLDQAARDLSAAIAHLQAHDQVRGQGVGVVGLGLGGEIALWLATLRPDAVNVAIPFYGVIAPEAPEPDRLAWIRSLELLREKLG